MIMGERNTFYFHISTLARRSSNRIHGLKDYVGNWIFYLNAIKSSLVEGYKSLYQTEQTTCSWNTAPLPSWGAILSTEDSTALARPLIDVEIFEALHSMKPFKAPSPDGLHAVFFQKFWEVVGTLVKHAIHDRSFLE
jgi:hypothetical protein